jgi:hypothetical protein
VACAGRRDDEPMSLSKSSPSRKFISLGFWYDGPAELLLLDQSGGGASGAGRGVALLFSMDSSEAIDSVRPPSKANKSPTFRS